MPVLTRLLTFCREEDIKVKQEENLSFILFSVPESTVEMGKDCHIMQFHLYWRS